MPALNKSYTLYYVVTLKDPIERGLKVEKQKTEVPILGKSYTQRPDRKGTERYIQKK